MGSQSQIDVCIDDLANTAKGYADQCRSGSIEATQARRDLLATISRLQTLLHEPTDFLRHLATQTQVLACFQWLEHFQVLAFLPLKGIVGVSDIADLAGVPELQLCRVLRVMSAAGFLREPKPGQMAHTELSASFVQKPSLLDAALFLAETACPAALQMAAATERNGLALDPYESAYTVAFNTSFQSACQERVRTQRQWSAYLRYVTDVVDDRTNMEPLDRLEWSSLGNACIVDVGAQSTDWAQALAGLYPGLQFVVQTPDPNCSSSSAYTVDSARCGQRITVQQRADGEAQTVQNAAVYMVRLTSPGLATSLSQLRARIVGELRGHWGVLSANPSATLILALRMLPEPGSVDPSVEAPARLLDMSLQHLANEHYLDTKEAMELIDSVRSGSGRLVVDRKIFSRNTAIVALGVKYQAKPEGGEDWWPPAFPAAE
ncbi:hypothetical protein E8E14_013593 [Neopestalotiopsis sp. 37M]|nr:hypothetical protein E8E14_013593 [Neopestalotiopsis sp. 37M]